MATNYNYLAADLQYDADVRTEFDNKAFYTANQTLDAE